jgi:phosphate transport system protein
MGDLATGMVADACGPLAGTDAGAIARVRASEPVLDRFQIEIDAEAIRLITIFAPVARDLRFLLMIARVTTELERIGDEAVDACEYLTLSRPPPRPLAELRTMSEIVVGIVRDAALACRDEDTAKAKAIIARDRRVDALHAQIFRSLLEHRADEAGARAPDLTLALLARSLERIADHATNVCEEVIFMVEGADIRHQAPAVGDTP